MQLTVDHHPVNLSRWAPSSASPDAPALLLLHGALNDASVWGQLGPAEIARYDRMRNITFEIELNGRALSVVEEAVLALPSSLALT